MNDQKNAKKKKGQSLNKPIAIIGIGCRYPGGGDSPEEFWQILKNGVDAITKIPSERWNIDALYHPDNNVSGKINTLEGGFVKDIDKFDPQFFEISPIEAMRMDPQQRMLLEVTHQAIEDGGLKLEELSDSSTGVFVGLSTHDYGDITTCYTERALIGGTTNTGTASSIAANRISYIFNLKGPSISMDTACSSALNAIHFACYSIWSGDCEMAIACGANALLKPETQLGFSMGGFLSPDSRCKSFDASGRGYVRSEGAGAVIIKPLDKALEDGDDIYAAIIKTSVNQDGRTTGLPVPNLDSQVKMLKKAYADAGIDPRDVYYIEAHGTGTKLGDFTEGTAIGTVFGKNRKEGDYCIIGSVKSNIGHMEAGSGIAGITKLALTLKNKKIPPVVHFKTPHTQIEFEDLHLRVPTKLEDISVNGKPLYGGVNSFGFGGANVHLIMQGFPAPQKKKNDQKPPYIFTLSAKSKDALNLMVKDYIEFIKKSEATLGDICFSAATRRSAHENRLALVVSSKEQLLEYLQAFLDDEARPGMNSGKALMDENSRFAFVFSGQGPQWWAMGRQLIEKEPVFKENIEKINQILKNLGWLKDENSSLLKELSKSENESRINETEIAQPAIFAVQVALAELWKSYGIYPDAVVGHSIGEVAASYISGALSLEEASKVVYWRSRCQSEAEGTGKMLAVGLPEDELKKELSEFEKAVNQKKIDIAVINGPKLITVSGDSKLLIDFSERLTKKEIFNRFVRVNIPFHSYQMDMIKDHFLRSIGKVKTNKTTCPIYSTVTKTELSGNEFTEEYWWRNIREPVLFYPAVKEMIKKGFKTFIEISPHPILVTSVNDTLEELGKEGLIVQSLRRKDDEKLSVLGSLGKLFTWGYKIDWKKVFYGDFNFIKLPFYPWQKERCWIESEESERLRRAIYHHPHLKGCYNSAKDNERFIWDIVLDKRTEPYIEHHRVQGPILYPGAGHVELGLSAAIASFGLDFGILENLNFDAGLFLPDDGDPPKIQLEILSSDGSYIISSKANKEGSKWRIHSNGRINIFGDNFVSREISLSEIKERLKEPVPMNELFENLIKHGLQLGPIFQCCRKVWRNGDEAIGEIHVHEEIKPGFGNFNLHPAILDSCWQSLFGALYDRKGSISKWMGVYIPVHIDRIKFYRKPETEVIWCYAKLLEYTEKRASGDVWLLDNKGQIIAEIQGVGCRYLEGSRGESEGEMNKWFYQYNWVKKPRLKEILNRKPDKYLVNADEFKGEMEKFTGILDKNTASKDYKLFSEDLKKISAYYIMNALKKLDITDSINLDDAEKDYGIYENYVHYFRFLVDILKENAYVKEENGSFKIINQTDNIDLTEIKNELLQKYPDFKADLDFADKCLSSIAEVISGKSEWESIIYSGHDWGIIAEHYTNGFGINQYINIITELVKKYISRLPSGQMIRIIEIGAGTSSLSKAVLSVLSDKNAYYYLTDKNGFAVNKSSEMLADFPNVEYLRLNIEEDIKSSGIEPGSFDILIASEVIHSVKDKSKALNNIKKLLAPKGKLILAETTGAPFFYDVVFGIYGLFDDTGNNSYMLNEESWKELLNSNNYTDIHRFACGMTPHSVFTACTPEKEEEVKTDKKESGTFLVFADKSAIASEFISKLKSYGNKCITAGSGKLFKQIDKDNYEIGHGTEEDISSLFENIEISELTGMIYMRSLDYKDSDSVTVSGIGNSESEIILPLLNVVKKTGEEKKLPKLLIVTSASEKVNENDSSISIEQASLWGLGRVIMNEYPDFDTRIVDLSSEPGKDEIENLVFEIDEIDEEVALRGKERYIHKLERVISGAGAGGPAKKMNGIGSSYRADISEYGVLDNIKLHEVPRKKPGNDEVEIEIHASTLNFRDVMVAMGLLSENAIKGGLFGRSFGLECSGVITAVGKNVKNFKPGDEVIGVARYCLSGFTIANAKDVSLKPKYLSFEEAATIPMVYLTAYYSLNYLCRMEKGDKVLIHSATGGVGIAAVKLAQLSGAEIYATAGTDEKRDLLRSMGVKNVFNSRTLEFKDRILELTGGEGVDIILNSLSGRAIHQNIKCLAPFGRFVEIGKTDIYRNSQIGLEPFGNNLSYFAVDIDRMLIQKPDLINKLYGEVMKLFNQKKLTPHPFVSFSVSKISDAFQYLAQAKQIGKVVISMNEKDVPVYPSKDLSFSKNSAYFISGGCSGFGLALAGWMSKNGAGTLALMSRSGPKTDRDLDIIEGMKKAGTNVEIYKGDITNFDDVKRVISEIDKKHSLKGVIHCAMVLDDAPLSDINRERYMKVFMPKASGACNLHKATLKHKLDFFVMFSSIAAAFGSPGQGNYAAANVFLDKFSQYRRSKNLPSTTIGWGVLGETGVVSRSEKVGQILESQGWKTFNLYQSTNIFKRMLINNPVHQVAANADWDKVGQFFPQNVESSRFGHLHREKSGGSSAGKSLMEILADSSEEERMEILEEKIVDSIARVLGTSPDKIERDTALTKMGLDSLMANQIRNWIHSNLGIDYPLMRIMQGPSILQLTEQLVKEYSTSEAEEEQLN